MYYKLFNQTSGLSHSLPYEPNYKPTFSTETGGRGRGGNYK